jgi:hypothetical protein
MGILERFKIIDIPTIHTFIWQIDNWICLMAI